MKSILALFALAIVGTQAVAITAEPISAAYDPAQGGDAFMNRVLNEFATKEKDGKYTVSRANALKLASEIIRTNPMVASD